MSGQDVPLGLTNGQSPLAEPAAEPDALDVFFGPTPEAFTDADLAALVAAQRAERERRAVAKARKAATKPKKAKTPDTPLEAG